MNKVEKLETTVLILLRDGNHQSQVGFGQLMFRLSSLGLPGNDHLMRSLYFEGRNVMFGLDFFQPAFSGGDFPL